MDLRAIFLAGMEMHDTEQRQAFIEEACGTNLVLRERVEAMFRAHDEAEPAPIQPNRPASHPGARTLGQLGDYQLLEVLGKGGMGVVYLAQDQKLQRKVAVKVLQATAEANSKARQRFLREARAAAGLESDHVVPIYQVGEDNDVLYLVMPFLKGESLDTRLSDGRKLPLSEVLQLGQQIARGLAAAHAKGLIHRDIKPGNIWLEACTGRVKILDFGLARAVQDNAELTQVGQVVGTPAYMAPEQAVGSKVDHRADLFSLGAVLYHACTGEAPFKGKSTAIVVNNMMTTDLKPLSRVVPNLPRGLSDLVMQLLAKVPDQRPASANEVVKRLHALEHPESQSSAPRRSTQAAALPSATKKSGPRKAEPAKKPGSRKAEPLPRQTPKRQRRRLWPWLVGGAILLGTLVLGVVIWWLT